MTDVRVARTRVLLTGATGTGDAPRSANSHSAPTA